MKGRSPRAGLLVCAAWTAFGQGPPASPAFEVASVKPAAAVVGGGTRRISSSDPGRVTYNNATLRTLIMRAYEVKDYQISGPDWLASEHYDVAAKLPENAPSGQVPRMLQALLAERFSLALHHEVKDMPGYALVVAKGGFKLKPVDGPQDGLSIRIGGALRRMQGKLTMARLADALVSFIGSPVADATGIEGTYDINLEWSPDDRETGMMGLKFTARDGSEPAASPGSVPDASAGPSIFGAVGNLGLKLEPRKAPMDILVVDRAEKSPTEN